MTDIEEPVFTGLHGPHISGFLKYKRSIGLRYGKTYVNDLQNLNHLLNEMEGERMILSSQTYEVYMAKSRQLSSGTRYRKSCVFRQYAIYLRNLGFNDIYVPETKRLKVSTDFTPYIFTKDEISAIFIALNQLTFIAYKNSADFYRVLIALLYTTGMRLGEALSLKVSDADLVNGILKIESGKGNVSRLVPMHPTMTNRMLEYKNKHVKPDDYYFFTSPSRGKRGAHVVLKVFQKTILPKAGINVMHNNHKIRIHDLRHTFCCHTLNSMAEKGIDTRSVIMYLSAYVGHKGIESTEWYLRLTEERFESIREAADDIYEKSFEVNEVWY